MTTGAKRRLITPGRLIVFLVIVTGIVGMILLFSPQKAFIKKGSVLHLNLKAPIVEKGEMSFFVSQGISLRKVLDTLESAAEDDRINGIYFQPDRIYGNMTLLAELREALIKFKESGKSLTAFMTNCSLRSYFLASIADTVCMLPTGSIIMLGINVEVPYLKETLGKLGVTAQVVTIGDYKTAMEFLEESEMSSYTREQTMLLMQDSFDYLISKIAESRNKTEAEMRNIVDKGIIELQEAVDLGLLDRLAYEDELTAQWKPSEDKDPLLVDYSAYSEGMSLFQFDMGLGDKIAVIYGSGMIVEGRSGSDPAMGALMGSESIVKAFKEAREDDSVVAVVFRIDSGGGSGIASDIIRREVELTVSEKPVIASFGNVAASGGYYVAMSANKIIAHPTTITGSIGVMGSKFVLKEMYEKIGVNMERLQIGENSDLFSSSEKFDEEQKELLRNHMRIFYEDFVSKAAEGRTISYEDVHRVAQGRVWSGIKAKEHELIDKLGGFQAAVRAAKVAAELDPEKEMPLTIYPRPKGFIEQLAEMMNMAAFFQDPLSSYEIETAQIRKLFNEAYLLLTPYSFIKMR